MREKPAFARSVELVLARRAAAATEEERARFDRLLESSLSKAGVRTWLGMVGAVVAILAIPLTIIFAISAVGYSFYNAHQIERAVTTGTPTTARIERMAPEENCFQNSKEECLTLTVKLYPASGAPYSSSFTQPIPDKWMSRVQPGSWLTVAVDPKDPQKVTFDERTMYVAPPAPPASALEAH